MTSDAVPLGCPDCGAKWPDAPGPMQALDGQRFECAACGRGFISHVSLTLYLTRT